MAKAKGSRAVIYARISSDARGDGAGVERQLEACRELAARDGFIVVAELVDNDVSASAYSRKARPAWRELLERLERGEVDCLLAWATDRLYRKTVDLELLIPVVEKSGAEVRTVVSGFVNLSTSEGRANARVMAAMAAFESERKSERIRLRTLTDAKAGKVARGGLRPFGYQADGTTIVPKEAKALREGIDRVLAGDSLSSIANAWNAAGILTTTGGRWRIGTLRNALVRWRNAGIREHHGELYPATWPPIVDRPTVERVRAVLLDPSRRVTTASPRVASLRGLAFRGRCGEPMVTGSASSRREDRAVRTYRCGRPPQHRGCGGVSARAIPVEAEVFARVGAVLEGDGMAAALSRVAGGVAGSDSKAADLVAARQRLELLSEDYYGKGRVKRGEYERRRADLEALIAELERSIAAPQSTSLLTGLPSDADGIAAALHALPAATAYALLRLVIARITIDPATPGRFDPERIRIDWAA
jgi:site-specific DNA recombinase